ncbi:MAG: PilZ domain-containing protein [Elusimicrobia bacterium]|nr:PilZ domain-containing protein [Elusimicrobiota bacterium]
MDKSRRVHARFPSDLKVEVYSGPVGGVRIGEGVLLDLSLSGCLLRARGLLKIGSTYRLHVQWKEGALDLPGRVARDAGRSGTDPTANHYGLAFNLTGGQEKSLMRLIDLVRRTERPEEGGFMRSYWG